MSMPVLVSLKYIRGGSPMRMIPPPLFLFVLLITGSVLFRDFREHLPNQESFQSGVAQMLGIGKDFSGKATLPMPEGPKKVHFSWKYAGREYALDETLYDSYYQFYRSLPVGVALDRGSSQDRAWWATLDELFLTPVDGDTTITDLAQSLKELGRKNALSDDQMAEFVAVFVQSIPYDQMKTDRRARGQDGLSEKTTYPYEVLYDRTGVCQDKSYLAYRLLQELGYGVSIFLFPDPKDNHMAVGLACPKKYSNYDSGFCFLETTSVGNKIGMIPDLSPETRVATADIEIDATQTDQTESHFQPLGQVEVINVISGKEYAGIIGTIQTRDELARLKGIIFGYKSDLKTLSDTIAAEERSIKKQSDSLNSLKNKEKYEEYNEAIKPYNTLVSDLRGHITKYNALVEKSNTAVKKYNALTKAFYMS